MIGNHFSRLGKKVYLGSEDHIGDADGMVGILFNRR
jgi:hypothetical protein